MSDHDKIEKGSDRPSEVKLVCPDGHVRAEKHVLTRNLPYFHAAFGGDWIESECGELQVNYPVRIVKEVVAFLHTDHIVRKVLEDEPVAFIKIADAFGLEGLKTEAEPYCIKKLDADTLKDIWQTGYQLNDVALKDACVTYAKRTPRLKNDNVVSLIIEDRASWDEFVQAFYTK